MSQFQALRRCEPILARFESAASLLAYLADVDGNLDDKDQIYATLVRAVQARASWAKLATALLWCGLWPRLDRIHRRHACSFRIEPEELVQEISLVFTKLLWGMDLARVHRVAATLVRNTERELMDQRRRQLAEQRLRTDLVDAADQPSDTCRSDPSFPNELAALRARLAPVIGADADLLLGVVVLGADQHEIAVQLGLSHEAARKRFQRAVARIRRQLRAGAGTQS